MSFLESTKEFFKGFIGKSRDKKVSNNWSSILGSRWNSDKSDLLELYSGWVYAATNVIAQDVAQTNLRLYKKTNEGVEEVNDNPFLDLMNDPNNRMNGLEFRYTTTAHQELTGDAFWIMPDVESETEEPDEIFIANPKNITIETEDSFPFRIKNYIFDQHGRNESEFKPYQVVHFKYPNPNDSQQGLGTAEAVEDWIAAEHNAAEYNLGFFKNGAKLSGLITSERKLKEEDLDLLRKSFEKKYSGKENAYKIGALPAGTDYEEMGQTRKELDFVDSEKNMRDKILAGFQTPKTVLGIAEDATNRATAETADVVFSKRNIKPKLEMFVTALNQSFIPRFGDNLVVGFDDPVPEDEQKKIEKAKAYSGGNQVMTYNEIREEYFSLPPVENGDAIYIPQNQMAVGEAEEQKEESNGFVKKHLRRKKRNEDVEEKSEEISDKAIEAIVNLDYDMKTKELGLEKVANMDDEEFEENIWKAFNDRVLDFEMKIRNEIKDILEKQRERVVEKVRRNAKAVEEEDVMDIQAEITLLEQKLEPIFKDFAEQEVEEISEQLAIQASTPNQDLDEAVAEASRLLSESFNETTAENVANTVQESLSEGDDFQTTVDKVNDYFDVKAPDRAKNVARTESVRMGNLAAKKTYEKSSVVKTIKWFTAADSRVCDYCGPLHDTEIGTKEVFFKKGDTYQPSSDVKPMSIDYSTVQSPPLHPMCRCYIRPEKISL